MVIFRVLSSNDMALVRIQLFRLFLLCCCICHTAVQSFLKRTQNQEKQGVHFETSVNEWDSTVYHRSKYRSILKPSVGSQVAVYRRSVKDWSLFIGMFKHPYDNLERILVFGGYPDPPNSIRGTWVYTPFVNSWYRLPLSSSEQPVDRIGHIMVSLCKTTVVLFGGFQDRESYTFNDIWIFDGIREEWKKLKVKMEGEDVKARAFHTGVVLQQERSSCQCKESLFVFGGLEEYGNNRKMKEMNDLLELRCQKEEDGERTYTWYRHEHANISERPKRRHLHHAVAINDSTMLVYGGVQGTSAVVTELTKVRDAWLFDSKRQRWRRWFAYTLPCDSMQFRSFVLFDKMRSEILHVMGSEVYRLDLTARKWIEARSVSSNSTSTPEQSTMGLSAVSTSYGVFVFSGVERDQDLSETRVWYLMFVGNTSVWQLSSLPRENPPIDQPWTYLYSCQVGGSLFIPVLQPLATDEFGFSAGIFSYYMKMLIYKSNKRKLENMSVKNRLPGNVNIVSHIISYWMSRIAPYFNVFSGNSLVYTQWQLDLKSNTWWQYSNVGPFSCFRYTAVASFNNTYVVAYGTRKYVNLCRKKTGWFCRERFEGDLEAPVPSSNVCVFLIRQRRWIEADTVNAPSYRLYPAMVDVGNGSIVMIGGFTCDRNTTATILYNILVAGLSVFKKGRNLFDEYIMKIPWNCSLLNDVWMLDLLRDDSSVTGRWTRIDPIPNTPVPMARLGHSLLVVDSMVFMIGGSDVLLEYIVSNVQQIHNVKSSRNFQSLCSHDLWYFDLIGRRWHKVQPSNHNDMMFYLVHPINFCKVKAAVLGRKILAVRHNVSEKYGDFDYRSDSVVTLSLDSNEWIQQTDNLSFPVDSLHVVDNSVYASGSLRMPTEKYRYVRLPIENQGERVLTAMRPGCHAGWYSENWSLKYCSLCPIGKVAVAGSTSCSPCPSGLTTKAEGATNMTSCLCDERYCGRHGTCFVVTREGQRAAHCQCEFGYTGSRCQYPTYYIITVVAIAVLLILLCLVVFLQRMIKYRRMKRAREMEVEEMGRVWTIDGSELRLIERIDGETPGSYGNVYRARYRDMNVAVKKLKMVMRAGRQEREFEREILLMRSIRHANIVLFVGAGRFAADECPFLVLEFMQRGALSAILHDESIYLDYMRQITFCLDAAKGMEFLHSLQPPRIHRDLKSSNLLVSEEWTVKVADFGAARLVKAQRARQTVARRRANAFEAEDLMTPLLQPHSDLSRNAGAVLWRAPEIFLEEAYGTSADVYR